MARKLTLGSTNVALLVRRGRPGSGGSIFVKGSTPGTEVWWHQSRSFVAHEALRHAASHCLGSMLA